VKQSHAANDKLIDRTRQVWQPRLGRDVSREDARQITQNVTGFFGILAEWSRGSGRLQQFHLVQRSGWQRLALSRC
jgi:hypothetical protein